MLEVLPLLHLASWTEAQAAREALGPGCVGAFVVNCTKDFDDLGADTLRVAVDDNGDPEEVRKLAAMLPSVVRTIEAEMDAGKPVIVHCLAGRQRSAAVCAAVVMRRKGVRAHEAVDLVRQVKPEAMFPRANFAAALLAYEANWSF
eukprot:jgi/Tetstr1/454226/TSEL_041145.t1